MSCEALTWARNSRTARGNERVLLLVLADLADELGHCWASLRRLTYWANLRERSVTVRVLRRLEAANELLILRRGVPLPAANATGLLPGMAPPDARLHYVNHYLLRLGRTEAELADALHTVETDALGNGGATPKRRKGGVVTPESPPPGDSRVTTGGDRGVTTPGDRGVTTGGDSAAPANKRTGSEPEEEDHARARATAEKAEAQTQAAALKACPEGSRVRWHFGGGDRLGTVVLDGGVPFVEFATGFPKRLRLDQAAPYLSLAR